MFRLFFFVLLLGFVSSCNPSNEPGPEVETRIDSLIQRQRPLVKAEIDSLCHVQFDSLVNHYVDSLLPSRLQAIQEKIDLLDEDTL